MNRLEDETFSRLWTSKKQRSIQIADDGLHLTFPSRLFFPEHFEHRYAYPVVVWLHSEASSEYELDHVMPAISLRNYLGLAIRGVRVSFDSEQKFNWGASLTAMEDAEQRVLESLDLLAAQMKIDRENVFIAGHGLGGTLAQWVGLRNCHRFAGVASIHGAFPRRFKPLVRWKAAKHLPVLFMHGATSAMCDTEESCRSVRVCRSSGLNYRFVQFPTGDEFVTDMGQMINRFMMHLVQESIATSSTDSTHSTPCATRSVNSIPLP